MAPRSGAIRYRAMPDSPRNIPPPARPVIHVRPMGRLGNLMIQYLAAVRLQQQVPRGVISNMALPVWGIQHPSVPRGREPTMVADQPETMRLDFEVAAQALNSGAIHRYEIATYAQHMDNLPDRDAASMLFVAPEKFHGYDDRYLVINIRGAEILSGSAWHYPLIPIGFYADLIEQTGLRPVFMGQLGDDPYCTALRARFPGATFQPSLGPLGDFETIRHSRHVVISVSTFSWLAAWLSQATTLYLPLSGFFCPGQRPDIDLLPLDDARYRFFIMPFAPAVPVAHAQALHAAVGGLWREITPAMLRTMRRDAPRFTPSIEAIHEHFDEAFYVALHSDVQHAISAGWMASGWEHYRNWGIHEGRTPFRLDPVFYARTYPVAALELGQGDFRTFHEHWVAVGRQRGYRRTAGPA